MRTLEETDLRSQPGHGGSRRRLLVTAVVATLGVGIGSHLASAAPEPRTPSRSVGPMTPQSLHPVTASSEVDFGPGQCEPCVVGLQ